ncbi:MAG: class I SAM-dependent methyltransferase [Candidatus Promineifilaceae bacterium]|nr:class I SAM-dependent methyltransferase [Candidatus Promineifilaceae bacterium]
MRTRQMYNEHPFPNRRKIPDSKSDERYQYIYENFLHLPIREWRNKRFLDAGCGTGDVTWTWRRILHPSNTVFAVDLSEASVNIARAAHGAEQKPVMAVGSLLDLGIADNSIDVVHCSGVLVAIPDPQRAYAELVRVLKPGGYIILVLYHKYGRALHGWRRAVVDMLEPEDVDRRAELGGRLFGGPMRKWAEEENVPLEGMLYDQFGLLCESRYSVGDALRWFEEAGISYLGTWPPVEWSQLGKGLRFSKKFRPVQQSALRRLLLRVFPDTEEAPERAPSSLTRATMQALWAVNQQQLFSIAGRKRG